MLGRFLVLLAGGALLATSSWADRWDKKTVLTISEPVQVPGAVLPPGKYVVKLIDSLSNRHIVTVTNERENKVFTTFIAIPNWRLKPTGATQFSFWETPAGQPHALRAWFYPGDNFGQELAYPKSVATAIAAQAFEPVPALAEEEPASLKTAEVIAVEPPVVQAEARPAPAPEEVAAATPPLPHVESAPLPATMPATGGFGPLLMLAGATALALGLSLRSLVKR